MNADDSRFDPLLEFDPLPHAPDYSIYVVGALFGAYTINLCRRFEGVECWRGHGSIVRVLMTARPSRCISVLAHLHQSPDPEACCRHMAKPWNTDHPDDKIRLDNEPGSRVERWSEDDDQRTA